MLLISLIARIPYHHILTVMAFCILEFIVGWLSVAINIKTITTIKYLSKMTFVAKVIGTLTAVSYSLIPISLLLAGTAVDMVGILRYSADLRQSACCVARMYTSVGLACKISCRQNRVMNTFS